MADYYNFELTSNSSLIVFFVNCLPDSILVTQWAAVSTCLLLTIAPLHHTLCLWNILGPFNIREFHGCWKIKIKQILVLKVCFKVILMVRQIRNDFFKITFPPKKERNEFDFTTMIPQIDLLLFNFWRKLKTPESYFEINWPLKNIMASMVHFYDTHPIFYLFGQNWPSFWPIF